MSDFSQSQIITFDRTQTASITDALLSYQHKLNNHQAFISDGCMAQFDIAFQDISSGEAKFLQIQDSEYADLIVNALNCTPDGGYKRTSISTPERNLCISEVIFFALALEHAQNDAELMAEIRRTAQAIVDFARYQNDTSDMWVDDMRVFGAEALYLMARLNPQDATYLSQFFIPYWDDEHATGYEQMFISLVNENGWSDAMLKAFVWCDNFAFRFSFYGMSWDHYHPEKQPLGEYLQANPDIYPRFKQLIIERFAAQPMLATYEDDDLDEMTPVLSIYQSLFPIFCKFDAEEAQRQMLEAPFMASTLENEAMDLQRTIEASQSTPLCVYAGHIAADNAKEEAREIRETALYRPLGAIKMMNEFILSLPFAKELGHYVNTGEHPEILEQLNNINIWQHSQAHALTLHDVINEASYWPGDNNILRENLHEVLEHLARDLMLESDQFDTEYCNGLISRIRINEEFDSSRHLQNSMIMLRLVDCFYHLLGQQPMPTEVCDLLTGNEEYQAILTEAAYGERYEAASDGNGANAVQSRRLELLLSQFDDMDDKLESEMLDSADKIFQDRSLRAPNTWGDAVTGLGRYSLAAYLLNQDFHARIHDEYTQAQIELLEQGVFQTACQYLLKNARILGNRFHEDDGLTPEQVALIEDYFTADTPQLTQDALIDLFNTYLLRDEINRFSNLYFAKISEKQPSYHFLHDFDDDYQRAVLCFFWLQQLPLPLGKIAARLWHLMVAMAPVKMVHHLAKVHRLDGDELDFDNVLDEIEFYEGLNKQGIDSAFTLACELQENVESYSRASNYLSQVDMVENLLDPNPGMFAQMGVNRSKALLRGLDYIKESVKVNYHFHASLAYPEFNFDLQSDFERALRIFIELNTHSWERVLTQQFKDACLFSGSTQELPEKYKLDIRYHEDLAFSPESDYDKNWSTPTIAQKQGDTNVILITEKGLIAEDGSVRLGHEFILFDDSIDAQTIIGALQQMPSKAERIERLQRAILDYLSPAQESESERTAQEALRYQQVALMMQRYIRENLEPNLDNYGYNYSVGQFLWYIDEPRRKKLLTLLANHSYRGYKVLIENIELGYCALKVRCGQWNLADLLEARRDDYRSEAYAWLMDQLISLDVNRQHLLLWAVKYHRDSLTPALVDMARSGALTSAIPSLYVGQRCKLIDILSESMSAAELCALFAKDNARPVKDRLTKLSQMA
ncbi:hypothetical protein VST7929_01218 [Vibrio stylophorae]|uniref:Uncharacterized protein n=1 Tax=Vibrio stylophorae TaxID=659351 RepID=A0ABN8DVJ4_9VIBR|nr:hypothetical protein [Vibrio stylophorae]CAH0533352.1 hypothetical protein VST7929_01218 [Vibrio stylophorae]